MKFFVVAVVMGALAANAAADENDIERYRGDVKRESENVKTTPPAAGVDKASVSGTFWCAPLKEKPRAYSFGGHLSSYYQSPEAKGYELFGAAGALCHNDPKEPLIQKAAQEITQLWMNETGLSSADAVEAIKLWLDKDGHEAEQKSICSALALNDEVGGADRAFQAARRELFDCGGSTSDRISVTGYGPMSPLVPWLDSSAKEADEIVRLSFVYLESNSIKKASDKQKALPVYAIDQFDFKAFQGSKALALLDAAPYKGNTYARVVVKQAIGQTRLNLVVIDEAVKKLTGDADWKEILITAPQKGAAEWTAAAAKYKDQLQRSAELEQTAFGPSKKAMAGCQESLKKDLVGVLKPLKHETASQLIEQMNAHPVAGLLFRRYGACVAGAGDADAARGMYKVKGIRVMRGPRAAAYYATIDAVGKVRADRAKFALEEREIPVSREEILERLTFDLIQNGKGMGNGGYDVWQEQGVVKTAKKDKDMVKVVFAKDKQERWIESDCKTTNRIIMFEHDGTPIYYRTCKGSVQKVDVSPNPINVPAHLAEGVAPGKMLNFGVSNSQDKRISMPFEVYADKKGKKLIAWYGVGL